VLIHGSHPRGASTRFEVEKSGAEERSLNRLEIEEQWLDLVAAGVRAFLLD
jgi:hypothetical protein